MMNSKFLNVKNFSNRKIFKLSKPLNINKQLANINNLQSLATQHKPNFK